MSGYARIDNVDALREFRTRLIKFAEVVQTALADAEGEMARVLVWLETEANTYWTGQIRKRHEAVEKAKDAVRQKKLFKSPPARPSRPSRRRRCSAWPRRSSRRPRRSSRTSAATPRASRRKSPSIRAASSASRPPS